MERKVILDHFIRFLFRGTVASPLQHVLTPPLSSVQLGLTTGHYLTHPLDLFAIWIGGLGFSGALIGGAPCLLGFFRKYELNLWEWVDIFTPSPVFGQVCGRIGDYFYQEKY